MSIVVKLLECKTCKEVDQVVDNHIYGLPEHQRSHLCILANKSKRRIQTVNNEKKKSFSDMLN